MTVGSYNIIHKIYSSENYGGAKLKPFLSIFILTIIIASIFSLFASEQPDGLEWSVFKIIGEEKEPTSLIATVHHFLGTIQEKISFLPDYNFHNNQSKLGTSISGIIGSIITIIFAAILGILTNRKTNR
ncbi:PDGLE domain-containing protein [Calditerrivibrio nitroreducens]|uniref:PDGLE domain-containing protein n=1 Tax=Calditerrivibrio nitroreducens TaxID=477976 RepID=UPI003C721A78